MTFDLGGLGTVISAITTVVGVILAVAAMRVRNVNRKSQELAETRDVNVAQARYIHAIEMAAANNGWALPERPAELRPDYLKGRADATSNSALAELASELLKRGGA